MGGGGGAGALGTDGASGGGAFAGAGSTERTRVSTGLRSGAEQVTISSVLDIRAAALQDRLPRPRAARIMEHFHNPFDRSELVSGAALQNRAFLDGLSQRGRAHRFFSHPFSKLDDVALPREVAAFILASFYKVVAPFTGLLCTLAGRAPNLRARFALMDNIYEEMGCGELAAAHPNLYLRMLASVGVSQQAAESTPTLLAIERLNQHLRWVVQHGHFSVACAVLASAESTIPFSFPSLSAVARNAFTDVDTTFFERHGSRDEGHAGDASMLFALSGQEAHFAAAEVAVMVDLDHRSELNDTWMACADGWSQAAGAAACAR